LRKYLVGGFNHGSYMQLISHAVIRFLHDGNLRLKLDAVSNVKADSEISPSFITCLVRVKKISRKKPHSIRRNEK
jgi:hypothetical protein